MLSDFYRLTRDGREIIEERGKMTADELDQVAARIRAEALQGFENAMRHVIELNGYARAIRKSD